MPGFRFAEIMTGSAFLSGQRREMAFRIRARAPSLWEHLRSGRTHIEGTVTLEGVCREAPLEGDLWIRLPPLGRSIRYEFTFAADDGRRLRFAGQKDIRLRDLVHTMRTLPGEVSDEAGREVARATLRFPLRTLPSFLLSFRPVL
jgi:hypothetical protein